MAGISNERAGGPGAAGPNDQETGTPYEIALETGLLRLRHYRPDVPISGSAPVLLVYSLIKRPYILDLLPDRSVIRNLLRQGLSVYLTDWLRPSAADAGRGLHDYVESDLVNAVDCIRSRESVERVSLVGCCLGGFLATVYAALHPRGVERLVTFALPFESRPPFVPVVADYLARVYGNVPAWWIRAGLNARVSDPRSLPGYLAVELGEPELAAATPDAVALQRAFAVWLDSDVPFAGRLFRDVMGEAYGENLFATSRVVVGGRQVALSNIVCPVLNVCAEHDKLVPVEDSTAFVRCVGSRQASNLVFDCGHLGLMLSRKAQDGLWPHVSQWLRGDSGANARVTALTGTG